MSMLHTFSTKAEAELARARWERLGRRCFEVFESLADGSPKWAFWTN